MSSIFIISLAGFGSTSPTSKLTHVKSISIRGVTVSVGDLAEDALKAFTPEDENPYKGFERSSFLDPGRPRRARLAGPRLLLLLVSKDPPSIEEVVSQGGEEWQAGLRSQSSFPFC